MDAEEIRMEMDRLKLSETTMRNCEKLAVLSLAHQSLQNNAQQEPMQIPAYSTASAPTPSSDFLRAADGVPLADLLEIIDKHMSAVSVVFPKEHRLVLRMLEEAK